MGDMLGKFISFWAFILGVIIFGKLLGFMEDGRTTIIILIASAIVYLVWTIGRSKAKAKREQKEWEVQQRTAAKRYTGGKTKGKRKR